MSSVLPAIKFDLFLVMSNQKFVLSNQDGVLVGHMSFQEKKIICGPKGGYLEYPGDPHCGYNYSNSVVTGCKENHF